MQISPQLLFGGVAALILVLVLFPILVITRMSRQSALARQATHIDLEASRRSARRRRDGVTRSETVLTLPTYERDVNKEEELSKFEAEIKRLESDSDTPANQMLLAQLKDEVVRLNRLSSSSSDSSTLSTTPIPVPPPTYIPLDTIGHGRQL